MKVENHNWTILSFLVLFSISTKAQQKVDITKYNCFTASVKYQAEGKLQDGLLLFVTYNDTEMVGLHFTNVFLLGKDGQNLQIAADSNAFVSVYDVKVSENYKYLALMMVGEGHPWIEIYDLQKLISESKQDLIADVNPYPGNVNMVGWKNNLLIFESDINMLLKNENKDIMDTDMYEKFKKFSYNLDDKKFKELK